MTLFKLAGSTQAKLSRITMVRLPARLSRPCFSWPHRSIPKATEWGVLQEKGTAFCREWPKTACFGTTSFFGKSKMKRTKDEKSSLGVSLAEMRKRSSRSFPAQSGHPVKKVCPF